MKPLEDFLEIAAEVSGLGIDEIDVDAAIFDTGLTYDEMNMAFLRTAERNGRRPASVSPPEISKAEMQSPAAISGLRDLAAFSAKARARLAPVVGSKQDTMRSLAASIEAGRYIPGDLDVVPIPHHGRGIVLAKYGALVAIAVAIPTYFSERACRPLCGGSFNHQLVDSQTNYAVSFGLLILVLIAMLGPALRDLFRQR